MAKSYVVRRRTVLMLFWLFSLLMMRFVLSVRSPPSLVPMLPPRLPLPLVLAPLANVAYLPYPLTLSWAALLLPLAPPLPLATISVIVVLVESPFDAVSIMKSSSSNNEKSTGISLKVFLGELAYAVAADSDDAAREGFEAATIVATVLLLVLRLLLVLLLPAAPAPEA